MIMDHKLKKYQLPYRGRIYESYSSSWLKLAIGFEGDLLQHIPEDMKFFKEKTIGNVVVMERETFDSLPGKNPLKNRR